MSALHDAITRLSGDTEARLLRLYGALTAGTITAGEFTAAAVALVGRANATAYGLADVSLAAAVEVRTGRPTPALGLTAPAGGAERLAKGVATLLAADAATDGDLAERVVRFGRSEPVWALQDAYGAAMVARRIPGYRRVLSPGACQLCQWLYKDGHVYPAAASFHRHTGCTCHPEPVLREATT